MFDINAMMFLWLLLNQKNIAVVNVKDVDIRCILWGIRGDESVNRLNNSMLEDKGTL